jgi:hypothetical protein
MREEVADSRERYPMVPSYLGKTLVKWLQMRMNRCMIRLRIWEAAESIIAITNHMPVACVQQFKYMSEEYKPMMSETNKCHRSPLQL